ncbi:GGDEF domain-containing protein [Tahibacter soli]|uniref:diguanylate cyclase n=1 Tax=Tahibacter soli TaxID=2983605 RepID=A0A9X3YI22_9GAMM|nr:diguanylate cyclase [Tahibacter soli]MDC8011208.1 diguanylate cyclase [Tahibacter soli]
MLTIKRRLLLSHLLVILLGAGTLGLYLYFAAAGQIVDAVGERVLDNARVLAAGLDGDELDAVSRHSTPGAAARMEDRLQRALRGNPDLVGAYVAEVTGTDVRVVAATAPGAVSEGSGSLTVDELALLRGGLKAATLGDIAAAGAEGNDLFALAPIAAAPSRYVAGVRFRASSLQESLRTLRLSTLGGLLFGVLAALVLSRLLAESLQRRIALLGERCRALAAGDALPPNQVAIGDEFDRVIADFDATAQRLREAAGGREDALTALTAANAKLETRVEERAREIEDATGQLKIEIENRLQVEALLAEAALTDALTGLLNRRAMLEMLEQAVQASRGQGGFSMILADVDHFKHVNDTYGHGIGDQVLMAAARELESLHGDSRHAARWGGEEFFVLLPGTGLMEACRRAEELRARVERMPLQPRGLRVTMSLGVAELQPGEPLEDCLRRCDQALYRAKDAGRNTVVIARGNLFATMS